MSRRRPVRGVQSVKLKPVFTVPELVETDDRLNTTALSLDVETYTVLTDDRS